MNHNIAVILSAQTSGFRAQMVQAAGAVKGFEASVRGSTKTTEGMTSSSQRIAAGVKTAFAGMAAAAGMFVAHGVRAAAGFEAAMRNVNSISGMSEEALRGLSDQVLALSTRVPQSAQVLAEGLYEIASSGFQGAEGLRVLEASSLAASAGLTTTDNAAKAITGVLNAYGLSASDAADVSDVLFQTVNLGVVSFEELSAQLGDVIGMAAAAAVPIDEVGAAIAAMTLSGVSAAESTTSLNGLLRQLIDPSEALAGLYQELGYESGAAAIEQDGLRGVMERLREATGGNVTTLIELFPEIRAARGAFALMANDGENYRKTFEGITDEQSRAGATQRAFAEQMKGTAQQFKLFTNGINAAAIEMGTALLPLLQDGMEQMREFGSAAGRVLSGWWKQAEPAFRNLGRAVQEAGRFMETLGRAARPVGAALGTVFGGAIIAGVEAFAFALENVAGFLADNEGLVQALATVIGGVLVAKLATAAAAWVRMKDAAGAGPDLVGAWHALTGVFSTLGDRLRLLGSAFTNVRLGDFASGVSNLRGAFSGLSSVLSNPVFVGTAAVAMLTAWQSAAQKSEAAAKELRAELEADIDFRSIESMQQGMTRFREEISTSESAWMSYGGRARRALFETVQGLTPLSDGARRAREATQELEEGLENLQQTSAMMQHDIATVSNLLGVSADEVEGFLRAWEEYDPQDTSQTTQDIASAFRDTAGAAGEATPAAEGFSDAMGTVGDSTSTATDMVSALEDAIDSLIGTMLGASNAEIAYQQAIDDLSTAFVENAGSLDTNTEAGRNTASAINAAAEAAVEHANAIAESTGSVSAGVDALTLYRQSLSDQLVALGMSRTEAESYLATIGMTPENISTLIELEGAAEATGQAQQVFDFIAGLNLTTATPTVELDDAPFLDNAGAVGEALVQIGQSSPTATVTLNGEQFTPTAEMVETWLATYEDSSPEAAALLNVVDPQNRFAALSEWAANWEQTEASARLSADNNDAKVAIQQSRDDMASWNTTTGTGRANADNTNARVNIQAAKDQMANWNVTSGTGNVLADNSGAIARITQSKDRLANWDASSGTASANADNSNALGQIGAARSSLSGWDAASGSASVNAVDNATGLIGRVQGMLAGLRDRSVTITTTHRTVFEEQRVGGHRTAGPQLSNRWGGIVHARNGLSWEATIAPGSGPPIVHWGERETGGEAYIPRLGRRERSLGILDTAAGWYGMSVVPTKELLKSGAVAMAQGGVITPQVAAGLAAISRMPKAQQDAMRALSKGYVDRSQVGATAFARLRDRYGWRGIGGDGTDHRLYHYVRRGQVPGWLYDQLRGQDPDPRFPFPLYKTKEGWPVNTRWRDMGGDGMEALYPPSIWRMGQLRRQGFADGGIVDGLPGEARDVIAHGREMVLNAAQQARLFAMADGREGLIEAAQRRLAGVSVVGGGGVTVTFSPNVSVTVPGGDLTDRAKVLALVDKQLGAAFRGLNQQVRAMTAAR